MVSHACSNATTATTHSDARAVGAVGAVGDGQAQRGATGTQHGIYAPSVLVTAGRLVLVSFGEDILEFWGEVRAVWVAAAMVGVVT
jgi:hypothetical protein